jgi:hypothetical protein
MIRAAMLSVFVPLVCTTPLAAQSEPKILHWTAGQTLTYKVEQRTAASETAEGKTTETKTNLNETKRWKVLSVDPSGVATLELSLLSLRLDQTKPDGGVLVFDSQNVAKSDPQVAEQLKKYVGQPLAVLCVDGLGAVKEVKESKYGPAARFESEPPFVMVFPNHPLGPGSTWERPYKITLDPPLGTGEKYEAVESFSCKSVAGKAATFTLTTILKTQPDSVADRIPLLQLQPEGEVVFDRKAGRLQSANLHVDKELTEHSGKGSSYRFHSTYREEFQSEAP